MQKNKKINHDFDLTINLNAEINLVERSTYFCDESQDSKSGDLAKCIDTFGCLGSAGTFGGTFGCLATAGCCC
ncbi:MAG: hypothetical protein JKY19_11625 [Alcanivoracaceae bacterium]|nr:hypothetical protein [Alcanivoracaceae bacterium]